MTETSDIFRVWADPDSAWSAWVKPVVFAFTGGEMSRLAATASNEDLSWLSPNDRTTALVVDLPGAEGVTLALPLARRGYRPIPVYNALPCPPDGTAVERTAVDVWAIALALRAATSTLREVRISSEAAPAFLLDSNRRVARAGLDVGDFDNRSMCFTTDFPSGRLLRESGIGRVIVIERGANPDVDLVRVLEAWQKEGIALVRKDLASLENPTPLLIPRLRWWRQAWYTLTDTLKLRRPALGGFGAVVGGTGG